MKRYTLKDFRTDEACLSIVFYTRYGRHFVCPKCHKIDRFNLIIRRKRFDCQCGYGIYPLAGTIFHGSATPIRLWFYAIYLFAYSHDGVAAKELERKLGVTYKTAWRISHQIRLLFQQQGLFLDAGQDAEAVSIFASNLTLKKHRLHGQHHRAFSSRPSRNTDRVLPNLTVDFLQERFKNRLQEYVNARLPQKNADSFWYQLHSALDDTHHIISPKYLQSYVDEVVFRYNNRRSPSRIFTAMVSQAVKQKPAS